MSRKFVFEIDLDHSAAFRPHSGPEVRKMIRVLAGHPSLSDPTGRIIDSEGHQSGRWEWKEK